LREREREREHNKNFMEAKLTKIKYTVYTLHRVHV
jgi:hypothetical protein